MSHSLQEAYQSLGLEPGCSFENAKLRYRNLAKTSHPDSTVSPDKKLLAEKQMKTFNLHFEIVQTHFKKDHTEQPNCDCRRWQSSTRSNTRTTSKASTATSSKPQAAQTAQAPKTKQSARSAKGGEPNPGVVDPLAAERVMQDAARSIWRNKVAFKNQEQKKAAHKAPTITDFILKQSE